MTLRREMLQAASRARVVLGGSTPRTVAFLQSQMTGEGGFRGRSPQSDLYYSVFGIEGLVALGADLPRQALEAYLAGFGGGESLDFVHLACLVRCWADLSPGGPRGGACGEALRRIESFRTADGGYSSGGRAEHGTAYGCFLALGAYQDCGVAVPDPGGLGRCLASLRADDGAFANERGRASGATPATAAAAVVLRHLGQPVPSEVGGWLLARCVASGGFLAAPQAPLPDVLSTATALHALALLGLPLDGLREPCLDFLDSLWDSRGGFHGSRADDALDCEYTFYGLLALGHLAEAG